MTACQRLTAALVDLAADGLRPPCGEYGGAEVWLSDDPQMRALAVRWCQPCPIIAACDAAADEKRERWGVWAGRDRTRTPRRRRDSDEYEPTGEEV